MLAPSAGDVEAFVDLLQQRGDVFRGMLQIAIHGDDDVAFGFVKAGRERRCLAEIAAQANHLEVPIGLHQIGEQLKASVGRRVVDEKNFVRALQLLQHRREAVVEREDGVLLIVNRNDD